MVIVIGVQGGRIRRVEEGVVVPKGVGSSHETWLEVWVEKEAGESGDDILELAISVSCVDIFGHIWNRKR